MHVGGDHMVFSGVYGCPFVREGDVRRDATMTDFRQLASLAQSYPELDSAGGVICEPNDTPLDSRHLDMIYALIVIRRSLPVAGQAREGRPRFPPTAALCRPRPQDP